MKSVHRSFPIDRRKGGTEREHYIHNYISHIPQPCPILLYDCPLRRSVQSSQRAPVLFPPLPSISSCIFHSQVLESISRVARQIYSVSVPLLPHLQLHSGRLPQDTADPAAYQSDFSPPPSSFLPLGFHLLQVLQMDCPLRLLVLTVTSPL